MNHRLAIATLLAAAAAFTAACRDEAPAEPEQNPAPAPADATVAADVDHAAARQKLEELANQPTDAVGAAALAFDKYDHEFGRILDTEKVSATFKFTNNGKSPVTLGKPQASCGCTVPTLEKTEYAPGESGTIEVTFSPPKGSGKTTKNITIPIVGGGEPIRLSISANVVPILSVEPRGVSFINVKSGSEVDQPVVIKSRDPNVKIVSANAMNCPVKIIIDDAGSTTDNPDLPGQASFRVVLSPDAPIGIVSGAIEVKVLAAAAAGDEQKEQTIQLTVSGSIKGDLFTQPARFTIPSVAPGKEFESAILVRSSSDAAFKITNVEIQDANFEGVSAEFDTYEFGGIAAYRVTIRGIMPEASGKMLSGRLIVTTDVPGQETLSIVLTGRVPPPGGPVPTGGPRPQPAPPQPTPQPNPPSSSAR